MLIPTDVRSTPLFADDCLVVGDFRWNTTRVGDRRRGVTDRAIVVFPWTAVRITQEGSEPAIADSRTIMFYNAQQPYEAEQLVERPERSIFLGVVDELLGECVGRFDPAGRDRPVRRRLNITHGPSDGDVFLAQRALVEFLGRDDADLDRLAVQETVLWLIDRAIAGAYAARGLRRTPDATRADRSPDVIRRHRACADAAREVLVRRFREPLNLPDIAAAVGISVYHLCRVFRAHVGQSLHQYRTELRLRASLDGVCDARCSLAHLALDLGFASQSHYTTAFVRRFACTPAAFRRKVHRGQAIPDASTFLKDRPPRA